MTIRLVMTCNAFPEQYDAFDGDKQVGYLRLRHGTFRVDVPTCGGETIYTAFPKGDGAFEDDDERDDYLRCAVTAILTSIGRPTDADISYTVDGN
jgi:hypothetical protein